MDPTLRSWLDELSRQPLVLNGSTEHQANENLWSISFPEQAPSAADLVAFLRGARDIRREHAAGQTGPLTFYSWHDEMAGQLRFSTVRCAIDDLPFSAEVTVVAEPHGIVSAFLMSPYRGGIPAEEPAPVGVAVEPSDSEAALAVWACHLGARGHLTTPMNQTSGPGAVCNVGGSGRCAAVVAYHLRSAAWSW